MWMHLNRIVILIIKELTYFQHGESRSEFARFIL